MSDYIRDLEAELLRAARQRQRVAYLRRGVSGISPGGVLTVVGAMAGVAVAVVAIVLAGHARPPRGADRSAQPPAGATSLVAELAALRRPQTSADRSAPAAVLRTLNVSAGHGERIAPRLTRLLAVLTAPVAGRASGRQVRVFLVIAVPPRSRSGARAFASIATVGLRGGAGAGADTATSVFYTRVSDYPASGGGYNTAVVPDGVTRVRWDFAGQSGGAKPPRPTTVFATVSDNLAVSPASRYQGQITRVTWYGAHRQILKTVNGPSLVSTLVWRLPDGTPLVAPTPSRLLAQINLSPQSGRPRGPAGILAIYRHASVLTVNVNARVAPNTNRNDYAIWITSTTRHKLLGLVNPPVGSNGVLTASGLLPPNARRFTRMLITLETSRQPRAPGTIVLEGKLRFR